MIACAETVILVLDQLGQLRDCMVLQWYGIVLTDTLKPAERFCPRCCDACRQLQSGTGELSKRFLCGDGIGRQLDMQAYLDEVGSDSWLGKG